MNAIATPRVYFENPAGRVLEHPDGYVMFQYHPGPRKFHHLQALLTHTRNLLARHGWHRMLSDQRGMTPYTDEERAWIVEYWLDGSQHGPNGLYGAVLVAPEVFAQLPADQVLYDTKAAALTYRMFDTEQAAVAWLQQVP